MRQPPFGVRLNVIQPPRFIGDIPLRVRGIVVVAASQEVALLPLRSIHPRHILQPEVHQRIWLGEVAQDDVRTGLRVRNDVGHSRVRPALECGGMTALTRQRPDILRRDLLGVGSGMRRGNLRRCCREADTPLSDQSSSERYPKSGDRQQEKHVQWPAHRGTNYHAMMTAPSAPFLPLSPPSLRSRPAPPEPPCEPHGSTLPRTGAPPWPPLTVVHSGFPPM